MELVEGLPIDQYCRTQRLNITARLELFQKVCRAVAYAHNLPVVHRDLKPANILVTPSPDGKGDAPKLLDFGIAKLLQPGAEQTQAGKSPLTPAYASPEQRHGAMATAASDVYSLGVILYELLTGTRAFPHLPDATATVAPEAPSLRLRRSDIASSEFGERTPEQVWRRVRGDLDHIVLRALCHDTKHRYGKVVELLADLDRYLDHRPVQARRATFIYRATKFIQRYKYVVVSAALVLTTFCGGFVATTREAERAHSAQRQAEEALAEARLQGQRAEAARATAENEQRFALQQQAFAEKQRTLASVAQRDAEAQRSKAERRFNDVHELANWLIFDFYEKIEHLTGATAARAELVEHSLTYLDKLAREVGETSLRREIAKAYLKLGDYQGARDSYYKAHALLQTILRKEPAHPEAHYDLIATYRRLSEIERQFKNYAKQDRFLAQALEIAQQLVNADPASVRARKMLPLIHYSLAGYTNDLTARLRHLRAAYEMRRQLARELPNDPEELHSFSVVGFSLADAVQRSGEMAAALALLRETVAVSERALSLKTQKQDLRLSLTSHYLRLGKLMQEQDQTEARNLFDKTLALQEQAVAADPSDARARVGLIGGRLEVGEALVKFNDYAAAEPLFRRTLEEVEALVKMEPANPLYANRLLDVHHQLSQLLVKNRANGRGLAARASSRPTGGATRDPRTNGRK